MGALVATGLWLRQDFRDPDWLLKALLKIVLPLGYSIGLTT